MKNIFIICLFITSSLFLTGSVEAKPHNNDETNTEVATSFQNTPASPTPTPQSQPQPTEAPVPTHTVAPTPTPKTAHPTSVPSPTPTPFVVREESHPTPTPMTLPVVGHTTDMTPTPTPASVNTLSTTTYQPVATPTQTPLDTEIIQKVAKSTPAKVITAPLQQMVNHLPINFYPTAGLSTTTNRMLYMLSAIFTILGICLLQPQLVSPITGIFRKERTQNSYDVFARPNIT